MVMTNFTAQGNQKTYDDLLCSAELTGGRDNGLIVLAVVHSFLSVTAFLGNALILAALHKESSLHPPSKLLFRGLATTDLSVGIVVHPFYVAYCILGYVHRAMGRLSSYLYSLSHHSLHIMFFFGVYAGSNKRGQTPSADARAAIPTNCNFKANLSYLKRFVAGVLYRFDGVLMAPPNYLMVWLKQHIAESLRLNVLLRQNISYSLS